jgi:hypothetical protein
MKSAQNNNVLQTSVTARPLAATEDQVFIVDC